MANQQGLDYDYNMNEQVEIRGHEDGLLGNYYAATIIGPKINNRYQVRFRTLYVNHTNVKLEKNVHKYYIRPKPRHILPGPYYPNTKVDVYYRDGWWKAIVLIEAGDGYIVRLKHWPGEYHFTPDVMRVTQKWRERNNTWKYVPKTLPRGIPLPPDEDGYEFNIGEDVEITVVQEQQQVTYFGATITGPKINDRYRVEYKTLFKNSTNERVTEYVRKVFIRPQPLSVFFHTYNPGSKVNVFDNGIWWQGRVLEQENEGYIIRFRNDARNYVYVPNEMRIHQIWKEETNTWKYTPGRIAAE